jgi:hypothetical protein
MMPETVNLLRTLLTAVIGSGIGTTIVGALFKWKFDKQLETHKAMLQRGSKIHERQVEALLSIYSELDAALFYLQRTAAAGKLRGEADTQELLKRSGDALAKASTEFSKNKLLFSPDLATTLNELFERFISAGIVLNIAFDPMTIDANLRATQWDEARKIAYKDLPPVLAKIEKEARSTIHG